MEQRSADRSRRSTLASACGGVRARREAAQRAAKERTCDGCTGCYGCGRPVLLLTRLQIAAASGAPPGHPSCGRGSRHACGRISRGCGQGRTRSRTKPEANILMAACVACERVWFGTLSESRAARRALVVTHVLKRKNIVTALGTLPHYIPGVGTPSVNPGTRPLVQWHKYSLPVPSTSQRFEDAAPRHAHDVLRTQRPRQGRGVPSTPGRPQHAGAVLGTARYWTP